MKDWPVMISEREMRVRSERLECHSKDLDQWKLLKNFTEQKGVSKISIPETFIYITQTAE